MWGMASTPRNYKAGVPESLTFRWAFRLKLFEMIPELRDYYLQQLAHWAEVCEVDLMGVAVRSTHGHKVAVQHFDGYHRTKGIAAMMRNVMSALALKANETIGHEGRILERSYRSHKLATQADLVQHLAYVHSQDLWHGSATGWDTYRTLTVPRSSRGMVSRFVMFPEAGCDGPDEHAAFMAKLIAKVREEAMRREAERRAMEAEAATDPGAAARVAVMRPWPDAARAACEEFGLTADAGMAELQFLDVAGVGKEEAFAEARAELEAWAYPLAEHTRGGLAPHLGGVIDVAVTLTRRQGRPRRRRGRRRAPERA